MILNTINEKFYGDYKNGLFGKKIELTLNMNSKQIYGNGLKYYNGGFHEISYEIKYGDIIDIEKKMVDNILCFVVEYWDSSVGGIKNSRSLPLYITNMGRIDVAKECILKCIDEWKVREQEEKEREEQQKLEEIKHKEECEKFYKDCYEFHIGRNDNPYYELHRENLEFACIYVDRNKGLNFLGIDGNNQEDNNAFIPYDKIHYYEKAGSIHYTEAVNGSYSSFGGAITGATISKAGTLIGGLLFGPMGMAAGAVLSHKPQKIVTPEIEFDISSEIRKIDDRSVILNYYSEAKRQYIDIELPANIYNFLQTHLAEKKYDIVLEMEKKVAIAGQKDLIESTEKKQEKISVIDDMVAFENRVKKLKLMYENGLLSEEEFAKEKAHLLEMI